MLCISERSHSQVNWKVHWKGGREEGTLKVALLLEFARAQIHAMELSLQGRIIDDTKAIGMINSRGQNNGQREIHYREREGGIVCKLGE